MSNKLDIAATAAVTAKTGFEKGKGMCQRFARQCVEKVHGKKYDAILHQPSAKEAALAFKHDGRFVVDPAEGSIPGDLLYKINGSGGYGHVGIRVIGNQVAENSSTHWAEHPGDGRGFRTLTAFGHFDLIVRLPED